MTVILAQMLTSVIEILPTTALCVCSKYLMIAEVIIVSTENSTISNSINGSIVSSVPLFIEYAII
jgi:hypothetical protein